MKWDFMKPMAEIISLIDIKPDHIVAGAHGYNIMRSFTDERGVEQPFYSILFYNFSDLLINSSPKCFSQNRVVEELKKYEGQTEYFVKLIGINGDFRVSRCKFTRESIIARYRTASDKTKPLCKRRELEENWALSPSFSVKEISVSQVLAVQAQQQGSEMELVLIDPM